MASAHVSIENAATITEIIQFACNRDDGAREIEKSDFGVLEMLRQNLQNFAPLRAFTLGYRVDGKHEAQVTSDHDVEAYRHDRNSLFGSSPRTIVQELMSGQQNLIHAVLNRPTLGHDGPATANVVEYALTTFPVSSLTPDFKAGIEADFIKFDCICAKGTDGNTGTSYGWVLGEDKHTSSDEKAERFLVVKGWRSLEHFRRSTESDAFKEALPIFQAWKAPCEVWLVETWNQP